MKKPTPKKSPRKHPISDSAPIAFDSPSEPAPLATPTSPILTVLSGLKGPLPSPTFFAEQVKKISDFDLWWLKTREAECGEDPDYAADPRGVVMRRVARAVDEQLKYARELGGPDEIARLSDVARRVRLKKSISYLAKEEEEKELFLWFWSFHLCGRWLEAAQGTREKAEKEAGGKAGEKAARTAGDNSVLINLPYAFPFCPRFFLGQWWVRYLIDSMYWGGEQKSVSPLLFGKPKEGKPISPAKNFEIRRRKILILDRVKELLAQGMTLYQAAHKVAAEFGLAWMTVKGMHLRKVRERENALRAMELSESDAD